MLKSFSSIAWRLAVAATWVGVTALFGCNRASTSVTGWVTGSSISGATIRVYGTDGQQLPTAPASVKTFETGTFSIDVSHTVVDFRVMATGGTIDGTTFDGTMVAEVRAFDPKTQIVYVHAGTTLVAAYLARHPGLSLEEAEAAVKRFLQVPASVDVAAGLRRSNPYFDHATFLREAAENGGFDAFVASLAGAMDATADATHPFVVDTVEGPLLQGSAADILAWSGQQFASGALSYAGSSAMSYVLNKFGIDLGGDPFAQVRQQLDQISAQITLLQSQLRNVQDELGCSIAFYGYQGSINVNQHVLDAIETISQHYAILLNLDPKDPKLADKIKGYKQQILAETLVLGTGTHMDVHDLAVGNGTVSSLGAIKGLSKMLKACGRFINGDKSAAIQRQYTFLALHQIQACQMVVNYYTAQDPPLVEAADFAAKQCAGFIKELQDLSIPNALPPAATSCAKTGPGMVHNCGLNDQVVDTATGLIWWIGPWLYPDPYDFYPDMGSRMKGRLEDRRWMTPTCSDMETLLSGIGSQPDPSGWLQTQGFRAGFYFSGHPVSFATNDVSVRQTPFVVAGGVDYGLWYGLDGFMDFLWNLGWDDRVDPATGINPTVKGYVATSRHAVYSNGKCVPADPSLGTRVLLVRPPDAGERYSW